MFDDINIYIMKNHFFIPYTGNKRQEVERIYETIKDELEDKKYIVEPFCGSSALSYYISTKHPKKFTYALNDNNEMLIKLYHICKDENKFNELYETLKKMKDETDTKEKYLKIAKNINTDLVSFVFCNKIYALRPGLWPTNKKISKEPFKAFFECPMVNFLRSENVIITNSQADEIYNWYKLDKKSFIFLDPPYLISCNNLYNNPDCNIYEYLFNNDILKEKALICLCLENNWIIKLLFKGKKNIVYNKKYEISKKKTEHIIVINKKDE